MNKEKLIEEMQSDLRREFYMSYKNALTLEQISLISDMCAEAALKELDNEWVRTYENMRGDMMHRKTLYIWCKEFSYVFKGYYDCIIGVFKSDDNPIFDGNLHNVTHYQYEDLPSPPKDK